jgi:type IV secretory pathway VirB10-like protein
MKFDHLIIALAVCLALPTLGYAELYKWKDKNGQTQYTDTPPPSNIKLENMSGKKSMSPTGKEPLSTVTNPPPVPVNVTPPPQMPTVSAEDAAAKMRQDSAEKEKHDKQEKEAQAKLKEENCKAAKANLQSYVQGGRVYKMNEKGEREYLDDAGLKQGEDKARSEMVQYCN